MYTPPLKGKAIRKPAKVISPYSNPLQDIGHISALVSELRALRQDIIDTADRELEKIDVKIEEVDCKLKEVDETVGEIKQLEKGDDGKDADEQAVADFVVSQIKDWVHLQVIPQIKQPKDGVSPDPKYIVQEVLDRIPKVNEQAIVSKVLSKVPKQDLKILQQRVEVDHEVLIDKILKSPKLKLRIGNVDGLETTLSLLDRRYIHGGGDTVSAGTNVTITNVNGTKQINASSGGGFTPVSVTPVPDDTTLIYTASSSISAVVINGATYINGSSAMGGTISIVGTTITLPNPIGTGGDCYGIAS